MSSCAVNPVPAVKVKFLQDNMAEICFLGGAVKRL